MCVELVLIKIWKQYIDWNLEKMFLKVDNMNYNVPEHPTK